jgi:hypothetical protein
VWARQHREKRTHFATIGAHPPVATRYRTRRPIPWWRPSHGVGWQPGLTWVQCRDTRESLEAAHSAAQELGYWAWLLIEHFNGRDMLAGLIRGDLGPLSHSEEVLLHEDSASHGVGPVGTTVPVEVGVALCTVCGQRVLHVYPDDVERQLVSHTV